jgi:hypothetical protein
VTVSVGCCSDGCRISAAVALMATVFQITGRNRWPTSASRRPEWRLARWAATIFLPARLCEIAGLTVDDMFGWLAAPQLHHKSLMRPLVSVVWCVRLPV